MTGWDWAWIIWAVAAFGSFLAIEIPGYRQHQTLSEHVWRLLGIGKSLTWKFRFYRIVVIMALLWLLVHFATGGFW